jgi:hypothetical protein
MEWLVCEKIIVLFYKVISNSCFNGQYSNGNHILKIKLHVKKQFGFNLFWVTSEINNSIILWSIILAVCGRMGKS